MSNLTNAQLLAQLEAAHVSYEKLIAQHEALKLAYDFTSAERDLHLAKLQSTARRTNFGVRRSERVAPAPTAAQLAFRAALAQAKALALSTGTCVKV